MSASPVVDLDVWRERARVVRTAEPLAAPGAAAAPADGTGSVLKMPAPAGPVSVFGPVMAFGLVRRSAPAGGAAALSRPVHAPHLAQDGDGGPDAARRTAPAGPPELRVLPSLSSEPGVTSAPLHRLRVVPDCRGAARGPPPLTRRWTHRADVPLHVLGPDRDLRVTCARTPQPRP